MYIHIYIYTHIYIQNIYCYVYISILPTGPDARQDGVDDRERRAVRRDEGADLNSERMVEGLGRDIYMSVIETEVFFFWGGGLSGT